MCFTSNYSEPAGDADREPPLPDFDLEDPRDLGEPEPDLGDRLRLRDFRPDADRAGLGEREPDPPLLFEAARLLFEAGDPDLDLDLDLDLDPDFDLDLDLDPEPERDLERDPDRDLEPLPLLAEPGLPPPPEPEEEEDAILLLLFAPGSSPASLSAPLAILSFSSSLSSDEETIALETIFFFWRPERPSSCSRISAFRLARSAFFAARVASTPLNQMLTIWRRRATTRTNLYQVKKRFKRPDSPMKYSLSKNGGGSN